MNKLEMALQGNSDDIDFYLSDVSVKDFVKDIKEIKSKAACSTKAGTIKLKLQELIDSL